MNSTNPIDHAKAEHSVVAFWSTDTAGYLHMPAGSEYLDVYDTEALDADVTDQIVCRTCDMELDVTDENGNAYI